MPTLEELRKMLEKGVGQTQVSKDLRERPPKPPSEADFEGEATHLEFFEEAPQGKLDIAKMSEARGPKWTPSGDGSDGVLHFGKHKDKELSQIYIEEPTYLAWILREFSTTKDKKTILLLDTIKHIVRMSEVPGPKIKYSMTRDSKTGEFAFDPLFKGPTTITLPTDIATRTITLKGKYRI